jgi:hypothetical protein
MMKERIDKRRATAGGMHMRAAHAIAHLIALSYRVSFMSRHQQFNGKQCIQGTSDQRHGGLEGGLPNFFFSFCEKGSTRPNTCVKCVFFVILSSTCSPDHVALNYWWQNIVLWQL